eukprot:327995_1
MDDHTIVFGLNDFIEGVCGLAALTIICGFKYPRWCIALVSLVACIYCPPGESKRSELLLELCLSYYLAYFDEKGTSGTWDVHTQDWLNFAYGSVGYLNGTIWIYGEESRPGMLYYANITTNNTFDLSSSQTTVNHSFENHINSVSHPHSHTIWSVDGFGGVLVSVNPQYSNSDHVHNTALYTIPIRKNINFSVQCMTMDEDKHILYLLGGYVNWSNPNFGEILTFDVDTRQWLKYMDTTQIGFLKNKNGYATFNYGCSFNNNYLFTFGGVYGYYKSTTDAIDYLDLNGNNEWQLLPNITLNTNLAQLTAFSVDDDIYIFGGCTDYHWNCYVSRHIFDTRNMRITESMKDSKLRLNNDVINHFGGIFYVVHNYDESTFYFMWSEYIYTSSRGWVEYDFHTYYYCDGTNAVYNKNYIYGLGGSGIVLLFCVYLICTRRRQNKVEYDDAERPINQ